MNPKGKIFRKLGELDERIKESFKTSKYLSKLHLLEVYWDSGRKPLSSIFFIVGIIGITEYMNFGWVINAIIYISFVLIIMIYVIVDVRYIYPRKVVYLSKKNEITMDTWENTKK